MFVHKKYTIFWLNWQTKPCPNSDNSKSSEILQFKTGLLVGTI